MHGQFDVICKSIPLRMFVYSLLIVKKIDKSTLSYASILGLFEEAGINDSQYNNMNTLFYVG